MILRRLAFRLFVFLRTVAWNSPLAKSPFWAETFVRIGYRLRRWLGLAPKKGEVVNVHGNKMTFGMASEAYVDMAQDAYEPAITRLFEEYIKPGMVVVDVGAHIGYFTLIAANRAGPGGRVYAFEPAPDNFEVLGRNIALNGYQNITAVQKAVCDICGMVNFYMHMDTVAHSLYPTTIGRGKRAIEVETISLDYFFEQQGWPTNSVVKIDAEGAELPTLKGMTDLVARSNRLYLFMEFIPHIQRNAGIEPNDLIDTLEELGFKIRVITESGLQPLDAKPYDSYNLQAALFCELV